MNTRFAKKVLSDVWSKTNLPSLNSQINWVPTRELLRIDDIQQLLRELVVATGKSQREIGELMGCPVAKAATTVNKLLTKKTERRNVGFGLLRIERLIRACDSSLSQMLEKPNEQKSTREKQPMTMISLQTKMIAAVQRSELSLAEIGRRMGAVKGLESQTIWKLLNGRSVRDHGIIRIDNFARACGLTLSQLLRLR